MKKAFASKSNSAYQAISEAQRIAFAPVVFQSVRALRDLGILEVLDKAKSHGTTIEVIAGELGLSSYGVGVLIESGLSAGVVESDDENRFTLSKVGYFLLHDRMTRINMDWNHFVCYRGMYSLAEAIAEGRPAGLESIDPNSRTLYEGLPRLPKDVRDSWYAYDHFYSDDAYPSALKIVLSRNPTSLVDVGANQGRFTILAAKAVDTLSITMIDLPEQLADAVSLVGRAGFESRVDAIGMDVRDESEEFPKDRSVYWLSQFVCCFSESEVIALLRRIRSAMNEDSRLYILETCWDQQQHEAAAFSLINTSPYFTCMANGNSKMYSSKELLRCIELADLKCELVTPQLGSYHTLFECSRAARSD